MKLHLKSSRGNSSKYESCHSVAQSMRVVILVCDTLSRPVLHNCKYYDILKGIQVMERA